MKPIKPTKKDGLVMILKQRKQELLHLQEFNIHHLKPKGNNSSNKDQPLKREDTAQVLLQVDLADKEVK